MTTDLLRLAVPPTGDPWDRIASVEDAADLPWTMEPEGTASRHWAEQLCRRAGFEPDVRFESIGVRDVPSAQMPHNCLLPLGVAWPRRPCVVVDQVEAQTVESDNHKCRASQAKSRR